MVECRRGGVPQGCVPDSLVLVLGALQVCVVLGHRVERDAADVTAVAPPQTWKPAETHRKRTVRGRRQTGGQRSRAWRDRVTWVLSLNQAAGGLRPSRVSLSKF